MLIRHKLAIHLLGLAVTIVVAGLAIGVIAYFHLDQVNALWIDCQSSNGSFDRVLDHTGRDYRLFGHTIWYGDNAA